MNTSALTLKKHSMRLGNTKSYKVNNKILSIKGVRKTFGGQVVLDDVSFDLRRGQVVLLRGENGSGKTTLVNILTGNLEPDQGEIHININGNTENFVWPRKWWKELNPFDHFTPERLAWEGIGRVWQDIRLFPTMTTLDNVAIATPRQKGENPLMALLNLGSKKDELDNREKSSEWLRKLGLDGRLDSSCDKISLGQMKRVAIARAIQAGAKVLFLDEPLSGLDSKGISEVMTYLETLAIEDSITLVIVEHIFNIPTILKIADTIWTLSNGKLQVDSTDKLIETNSTDSYDVHNLLRQIAGDKGTLDKKELPNGARLTTVSNADYSDSKEVVLKVDNLVVKRGIRTVIDGLSFSLKRGQISILEAPNGWGKSTLLDAIAGVAPIESGKIKLYQKDINAVPTHKRVKMGITYFRANESPFMNLSVEENKRIAKTNNRIFNGALSNSAKAGYLSGGEKQKLLIEMLPEGEVYLLDEPMVGLDEVAIGKLKEYLLALLGENKTLALVQPLLY